MKLFILYILICLVIGIRIWANATGYLTPDSSTYLEIAQHLVDKTQSLILLGEIGERLEYTGTWPLGYPIFICLVSLISGLNVFYASKLLNVTALGGIFLLLGNIYKEKAYFSALIFCSFTFLEIFSHTWSEGVFLFMLLWFGISLHRYVQEKQDVSRYTILNIFFSALFMFLCRYVGAFSFILTGLLGITLLFTRTPERGKKLLRITTFLWVISGIYFLCNYFLTGSFAGDDRIKFFGIDNAIFFSHLAEGIINEFFIIRNYYFTKHYQDMLFVLTAAFQLCIMMLIYFRVGVKWEIKIKSLANFSMTLLGIGIFYFVVLSGLIKFGASNLFDYRVLAPFSMMFFLGIQHLVISEETGVLYKRIRVYVFLLFMTSLLLNLPKKYLLSLIIP